MKILEKIILLLRNKIQIDKDNILEIGKKVKIKKCEFKIRGKKNQLKIEDGVNLNGVKIEIRGEDCTIKIGKNTIIGTNSYLSAREKGISIEVGKECMFSRNVKLMTSDGHFIYKDNEIINRGESIFVGDKVWLADDVLLLKGSRIGSGSVVGIKSIVTKKFKEENIVIVGNPGRKIKEGIEWRS